MKKKLKFRVVNFNRRIAIELLEMEGNFEETEHIKLGDEFAIGYQNITLPRDFSPYLAYFSSLKLNNDAEREGMLYNYNMWLAREQFCGTEEELKIGEKCEVSAGGFYWKKAELLAILPKDIEGSRFITRDGENGWTWYPDARPIAEKFLTIDGEIYTWEI